MNKNHTFKGWIRFTSTRSANAAKRLMQSVHADICFGVHASQLDKRRIFLNAENGAAIRRIMGLFNLAQECGWDTTQAEREAAMVEENPACECEHCRTQHNAEFSSHCLVKGCACGRFRKTGLSVTPEQISKLLK